MEIKKIIKKIFLFFGRALIALIILIVLDIIICNVPHRIGKTNYYLRWYGDLRCIDFKDSANSWTELDFQVRCYDAYYNNEYILAYDLLLHCYCIIRIAENKDELTKNRVFTFYNSAQFFNSIDSLGIDIKELKYTKSLSCPDDSKLFSL